MHADDARAQECVGVEDRAIDVRFGGEIDNGVGVADQRADGRGIGDVAEDELEAVSQAAVSLDGGQVQAVAGVGQLVEDDNRSSVAARRRRTKLLPMNPAPPQTSSFTAGSPRPSRAHGDPSSSAAS